MKSLKFILIAVLSVFAVSVFAQDSTSVALVNQGISVAETKWPFLAKVVAVIAVISEVLSVIPSQYIPANGVVDMIVKWIKAIGKK